MDNVAGPGHNGGPPLKARNFKKQWAMALFCHPKKPAGAVAMAFKLYMEMDSQGEGAAVSDFEFAACCGVSDRSAREFKSWLVSNGFVRVSAKGARGRVSIFAAQIPNSAIPAMVAAIQSGDVHGLPAGGAGNPQELPASNSGKDDECRRGLPANQKRLPEVAAANRELPAAIAGNPPPVKETFPHTPLKENNKQKQPTNNKLASPELEDTPALAGLNGSAEPMLRDVISWMVGGDEAAARNWLAKFIQINGQEIVRQSYLKLSSDMLTGSLIARPIEVWGKIATRMRQEPKKKVGPDGESEETKDARIARKVREASGAFDNKKGYRA